MSVHYGHNDSRNKTKSTCVLFDLTHLFAECLIVVHTLYRLLEVAYDSKDLYMDNNRQQHHVIIASPGRR